MANLLPKDRERDVWRGFRARVIIVASLVLMASALLSGIALVPSYMVLRTNNSTPTASSVSDAQTMADRANVARVQYSLAQITPLFAATATPQVAVQSALQGRPQNVSIDQITYSRDTKVGTLMIAGSAHSGEDINTYRTELDKDPQFTSISIPVKTLVGIEAGRFTMTLTGNF